MSDAEIGTYRDVTDEVTFEQGPHTRRLKHNGKTLAILVCDGTYILLLDKIGGTTVLRVMKKDG
jgi:hypothetical protein